MLSFVYIILIYLFGTTFCLLLYFWLEKLCRAVLKLLCICSHTALNTDARLLHRLLNLLSRLKSRCAVYRVDACLSHLVMITSHTAALSMFVAHFSLPNTWPCTWIRGHARRHSACNIESNR